MSGTSMASPAAAGMAALVRQYYTDGFFPTGAAVAANRFTPSAALVKATMLNSTKVMTGTGTGAVPNNCQGWGRVLLDDTLFFTGQARTLFATDDPGFAQGANGQIKTFTVQVARPGAARDLAWTDFPSTPAAGVNLDNDRDLTVSGASGTFLGNVFANSQSTTGGTADRRNNVEQVTILAPAAGSYTITVRAFNVPSSAQPFALVVSGAVTGGGGATTIFNDWGPTRAGRRTRPAPTPRPRRWERANPETTTSSAQSSSAPPTAAASISDRRHRGCLGRRQRHRRRRDLDPVAAIAIRPAARCCRSRSTSHLNNSSVDDFFGSDRRHTTRPCSGLGSAVDDAQRGSHGRSTSRRSRARPSAS